MSDELRTKVLSDLSEIVDEYGLNFSHSDNGQFVYFSKYETGFLDAGFMLTIEYDICKVYIGGLSKTIELHQLNNCVRLLCEVIA
jgi:hypothetical protein